MKLDPNEEPQCCDECDTELEDGLVCPECGHDHNVEPKSRPCETTRAHVTPSQRQVEEGMDCWVCGKRCTLVAYEHRRYGLSYMMPEHTAAEAQEQPADLPQELETRKPWKEMTEEEQDQVLATWAAKQPDAHLAELFLVNGFATAVARAGRMAKGETRRSVFEQVHDAVVAEAKRREQKKRGELT